MVTIRSALEFTVAIAVVTASGSIAYRNFAPVGVAPGPAVRPTRPRVPLPDSPIPLSGAHIEGSASARVGILQYSDFQCPFCGVFARDSLPVVREALIKPGKLLIAFRHMPLDEIHPLARQAAYFSECAASQGKFWTVHDLLFASPLDVTPSTIERMSAIAGLQKSTIDNCMSSGDFRHVSQDATEAMRLGVTGTPTFFVGYVESGNRLRVTDRLVGAQKPTQIAQVVERLLAGK